jgi:hypothetical protein
MDMLDNGVQDGAPGCVKMRVDIMGR